MGFLRNNNVVVALLLVGLVLGLASRVSAQVMQSASYRIQSDSINVGGVYSTSSNYQLEDTTGEVGTGYSSSTSYGLSAGYQAMQETFISLSGQTDITLSPTLGGVSGGTSNGSTTVTVLTDSYSGYQLTIAAALSPAMQSNGELISDYAPTTADPDFSFTTDVTEAHLGFTPEGADIASRFKDLAGACNSGSGDTSLACWDGLSTIAKVIASRTSANNPSGSTTTVRFRVGLGASVVQAPGEYTATSTLTALPL